MTTTQRLSEPVAVSIEDAARYRDFFFDAPDPFCSVEVDSFRIVDCNHALEEVTGRSRTELVGRPLAEIHARSSVKRLAEAAERLRAVGSVRAIELNLLDRNGSELDVSLSGTSGGSIGCLVWRDVTHRRALETILRQARAQLEGRIAVRTRALRDANEVLRQEVESRMRIERALRESEARFRQIADTMQEVFWLCSAAGPCFLFVSSAYDRVWGRSAADVIDDAAAWWEGVHSDDRDRIERVFGEALRGEREGFDEVFRITRSDGVVRWVRNRAFAVRSRSGAVERLAGVGEDVTQLRLAEEKALQNERLATIGEVATGLAHESRNALQRAQACLELLAQRVHADRDLSSLADRLQLALDHLLDVYESVRIYAAPMRLGGEAGDLGDAVREAVRNVSAVSEDRGVRFELDLADPLRCEFDVLRIGQVFTNILENAVGASPDGGEVRVRAFETELREQPAIRVVTRDEGDGFTDEALTNALSPFFTTKTLGTGLGLAIARRIVDLHHGRIDIDNLRNGGAEVSFTIPLKQPEVRR